MLCPNNFFSKMSPQMKVYLEQFFLLFAPEAGLSGVGVKKKKNKPGLSLLFLVVLKDLDNC